MSSNVTIMGRARTPGAQQAGPIWHNFQRSTSSLVATDESSGSGDDQSTRSSTDELSPPVVPKSKISQKLRNAKKSMAYSKDEEANAQDASPGGLRPELDGEEGKTTEQQKRRRFYYLCALALVVMIVGGVAVGVFVALAPQADATFSNAPTISPRAVCDISDIEAICSPFYNEDDDVFLEEDDVPKCVRDNFSVVFIKSGNPKSYTTYSVPYLFSCGSAGMALKRLSAMEYEQHTSGMLACEYTLYRLYYEFGEIEWWTDEGVVLTNVCTRDEVECNESWEVQSFQPDYWGGTCILSELAILSEGST